MIIRRACDACGTPYQTKSSRSRFCSQKCRTRASRAGGSVVQLHPDPTESESAGREGPNVAAYRVELQSLGCLGSALGVQALTLAASLDASARETGNSTASVSRELRAVMAAVRASAQPASEIDELLAWRDRTRASIG